ncbi:hypothetical protein SAMN05428962_1898 [Paenibacillus sp. BC26]|nr:hypothetical protein SAMN05428962_1898 [Paenibacillus sp. BC26]
MSEMTRKWLSWSGIVLAVIGCFFATAWMGSIAVILGLICMADGQTPVR